MLHNRVALLPALGLLVLLNALPGIGRAQTETDAESGPVGRAFALASRHWHVPQQLLMAIGYLESRWEQRAGEQALDGGFGIMHLTPGEGGTLQRAAALTGLPEEALRTDATANIEGGAAVLGDISRKLRPTTELTILEDWSTTVAAYSGSRDASVGQSYLAEVYRILAEGVSQVIGTGERLTLEPSSVELPATDDPLAPTSEDYGPAIWVAAHSNNYSVGRSYCCVKYVVVHDTEGSYWSAINWFQNPNSRVSAHFVIRSSDGQVTQMVRTANTAYHAGNWDYNVRSIGIEHEGYMSQPGWYTEAMYQSSAALVRAMSDRFGLRKDRAHVIAHSEVPSATHSDPGPYWNWDRYMSLVRRDDQRVALVDNTDPGFAPVPQQITPQNYWYTYSGGYNNSNTYGTTSVSQSSSSMNSGTWTATVTNQGYYDIYAFIPYVDNNTPDTSSAKYQVYALDGLKTAVVSQKAITDLSRGGWAHLGRFAFGADTPARIQLTDHTGETGRSVWFDAVMLIPAPAGGPLPSPAATITATPPGTSSPPSATPVRTSTPPPGPQPTWTPGPCGMRFSDLPDSHWAYTHVAYLYCRGVLSGYDDGTFRPGAGSTRGQFAKMVTLAYAWTLYDPYFPSFQDVLPGSTFYRYVETAALRGVVGGYSDGTFRPNNSVTRAQAAKILVNAAGWATYFPALPSFSDVPDHHWAFGFIEAAARAGAVGGFADGTFGPDRPVTRAQLAKMVALSLQPRPSTSLHGEATGIPSREPTPARAKTPMR